MAKSNVVAETSATITDRGQTTVPAAIRRKLALGKRDRIVFRELADGSVVIAKKAPLGDTPDPALTGFLALLADDMKAHPTRLRPMPGALLARARVLTEGVEVDLDSALPDSDA